jgi:tRNA C32,U32 (ribose-2'-O)-methylase TrmJ
MMLKTILKIGFLLAGAFAFWCMAEDFLATPAQEKRKSLSQLRQEIVEVLATLVQQESKSIELTAQVQQELYRHIEEIAQGEKKSFFSVASREQLIQRLHTLKQRAQLNDKELTELKKFLTSVRTNRT